MFCLIYKLFFVIYYLLYVICHILFVCYLLQEREAVGDTLPDADLSHQIDARVVRLLKGHQTLTHSQLLAAVTEALGRPLDQTVFKKRLESLIDRDYISRDLKESHSYKYAA